jgi:hypothetical protein
MVDRGNGSMGSSAVLLLIVGLVDLVGLGRGLAHHTGMVGGMRAVHRGGHSRSIALLDRLVAGLVSRGKSHEGSNGKDGLK